MARNFHILLNDSRGVYIPVHFVEGFNLDQWGLSYDDWTVDAIMKGPESDGYWDAWQSMMDRAKHVDENGIEWSLYQDGDLFAVAWDWMTEEEKEQFCGF